MAVAGGMYFLLVCGVTVNLAPCSGQRLDKVREMQRKGRQINLALKKYLTKLHAVPFLCVVGFITISATIRVNPSLWLNAWSNATCESSNGLEKFILETFWVQTGLKWCLC